MEDLMNLHENSSAFEDAIRAASDHLEMRAVFVKLVISRGLQTYSAC